MVGTSLNGKIKYERSNQYWIDFGGDGYRVAEYSVLDHSIIKNFGDDFSHYEYISDSISAKLELCSYLNQTAGFRKRVEGKGGLIETVYYDTINQKLIYYFIIK